MNFKPKSETELEQEKIGLVEGPADFTINQAEETTSKAGNPMFKLTLTVWDSNGAEKSLVDYIVPEKAQWKLRNLLFAINKPKLYTDGVVQQGDLLGASGKAEIAITKDPKYGSKAVIKDYGYVEKPKSEAAANELPPFKTENDVPF